MRYQNFLGLQPKVKPTAIAATHGQIAVNLDIGDETLTGLRAPGNPQALHSVDGGAFSGAPETIYRAGEVWVAFPDHTWIAADTQGTVNYGSFYFVRNNALHWQSAERIVANLPAVAVGTCAPVNPPSAVAIEGIGCLESAPDLACVTDPLAPAGACLPATPILREYVYTYVRQYPGCDAREEESGPSPPVTVECLDGDAPSLTADPLPPGVTSLRWYRSVVGTDGRIALLFCGESVGTNFVDLECVHRLGSPLLTTHHFPPPACVSGVANLGDALLLVWDKKRFWVSQPFMPYAYDLDRDEFVVGFDIVGVVGQTSRLEGAVTYEAQVVTTGHPYRVTGTDGRGIIVQENDDHQPCVSARSIFPHAGGVIYASPYGLVAFDGEQTRVLTDRYMTGDQWRRTRPAEMRVGVWDHRVVMAFPDRDGMLMTLGGGPRPESLVNHTVQARCLYSRADLDLHLGTNRPQVYLWGAGIPMRWRWRGPAVVMSGLWHPTAAKVVGGVAWQWHDVEDELLAYQAWKLSHPGFDSSTYFEEHPSAMHLQAQLDGGYCHKLIVLRDGRPVYERRVTNARPVRLPRLARAIEWCVEVSGYGAVREVHMQTSIGDLAQDGGHS